MPRSHESLLAIEGHRAGFLVVQRPVRRAQQSALQQLRGPRGINVHHQHVDVRIHRGTAGPQRHRDRPADRRWLFEFEQIVHTLEFSSDAAYGDTVRITAPLVLRRWLTAERFVSTQVVIASSAYRAEEIRRQRAAD